MRITVGVGKNTLAITEINRKSVIKKRQTDIEKKGFSSKNISTILVLFT